MAIAYWLHSCIGIPQIRLRLAPNWVNKYSVLFTFLLLIVYIVHCVLRWHDVGTSYTTSVDQRAGISVGNRAGILFCFWVRSMEDTFWLYGQGRRRCACCSDTVLVVC
ncbi:hypothetical protein QL285_074082 [Trifolium repens]|nr:hypothetical protein QL285_074082 [Trifolium repens]